MNFIAIDFETANSSRASICSIGIVIVENGLIKEEIHTYIDPEDEFTYFNTVIHGITEDMVQGAPTFEEYWPIFKLLIEGRMLIAHNASFDMSAMRYALDLYNEPYAEFTYGCSYVFSKKVWPTLFDHKLSTVADHLGISFKHHDALEDARAAALVTLAALENSKTESLEELSSRNNLQLGIHHTNRYSPAGDKKGKKTIKVPTRKAVKSHPLFNADVVFTGKLQSMTRGEASQLVMNCGGNCKNNITRHTGYLVIGDYDLTSFTEVFNSIKMQKVEELINKGHPIKILGEKEFLRLVN
ncbi:exonuclease domain-containing protein [Sporosarcina sp. G11-34]|uniref:exonuclease domain-containing protein n=1 Tax=Sporosarcina sp. G11-34 TaxID=2849605 RepID=UPI0022A9EBBE|nr:exonuclease domain-containing protein [Sporosarcina sp. G11-34]MCZ2256901.1 3'-5' exoribonuclease [Sporosarcina sp. G11-34]